MRITSKGQVTIPADIRAEAGLLPHTEVEFIFDGKIKEKGVHMPPTLPYLYKPFMKELAEYGFKFKKRTIKA